LGIGTTSLTPSPTPTTVRAGALMDLGSISSISAGGSSVCAVLGAGAAGTLRCWGSNLAGQLGDGTVIARSFPTQVRSSATAMLVGIRSVDVGTSAACAVMDSGAVRCWGSNTDGQLGNNTTIASRYPVAVAGIDGVTTKATSVGVGDGFACALLTTGAVRCWGRNTNGQLGNNTTARSLIPVGVVTNASTTNTSATTSPIAFAGTVALSVGTNHSCAIATVSGLPKLFCWGLNTDRQLGVGTTDRWFAAAVFGTRTDGAIAVAAGPGSTLAVVTNASTAIGVNSSGQLGLGDATNRTTTVWSLRF
jgi:alpha-tubulin suppressor-like RCC1 family protein